jgi:hypothetical protein
MRLMIMEKPVRTNGKKARAPVPLERRDWEPYYNTAAPDGPRDHCVVSKSTALQDSEE